MHLHRDLVAVIVRFLSPKEMAIFSLTDNYYWAVIDPMLESLKWQRKNKVYLIYRMFAGGYYSLAMNEDHIVGYMPNLNIENIPYSDQVVNCLHDIFIIVDPYRIDETIWESFLDYKIGKTVLNLYFNSRLYGYLSTNPNNAKYNHVALDTLQLKVSPVNMGILIIDLYMSQIKKILYLLYDKYPALFGIILSNSSWLKYHTAINS